MVVRLLGALFREGCVCAQYVQVKELGSQMNYYKRYVVCVCMYVYERDRDVESERLID